MGRRAAKAVLTSRFTEDRHPTEPILMLLVYRTANRREIHAIRDCGRGAVLETFSMRRCKLINVLLWIENEKEKFRLRPNDWVWLFEHRTMPLPDFKAVTWEEMRRYLAKFPEPPRYVSFVIDLETAIIPPEEEMERCGEYYVYRARGLEVWMHEALLHLARAAEVFG